MGMEATMEKYNFVQFKNEGYSQERFDRKTWNPKEHLSHLKSLNRLRAVGHSRFFHQAWEAWRAGEHLCHGRVISVALDALGLTKERIEGKLLIDAGCGDSGDADFFVAKGGKAIGYDLFRRKETYTFGMSRVSPNGFTFNRKSDFKIQDICEKWPQEDASVDYVVCNAVLDLMNQADRCMFYMECARVMKVGGGLAIAFNHLKNGHGYNLAEERKYLGFCGFHIIGSSDTFLAIRI